MVGRQLIAESWLNEHAIEMGKGVENDAVLGRGIRKIEVPDGYDREG